MGEMGLLERFFAQSANGPLILSDTGRTVTAATADPFTLPIVVTCRQLISDSASSFPLYAANREGVAAPTVPMLLDAPDPIIPRSDFIERTVNDMTRHGAAWWLVTGRDTAGNPLALRLVDPSAVVPILDASGTYITGAELNDRWFSPADLVQVPFVLDDGPIGRAPIREIREATENLRAALLFSSSYYGAGALPPYALLSSARIPKAHADELMAAWLEARDKSRPALLTGDLSLQPFKGQSATDSLVIDALNYFDKTICAVFQIPPSMTNVVAQSSLTYSTTREEAKKFTAQLNNSILKRVESAFTEMLPAGVYAHFDTSSLLELNSTELLTNAVTAYTAGIISLDEARATLGKDLLP